MMIASNLAIIQSISWLGDESDSHQSVVGAKAAALSRLIRENIPVPPGFSISAGMLEQLFSQAEQNHPAWQEIRQAYEQLSEGEALVIVRSSAHGEDGVSVSYAGQYESMGNLHSWDELRLALRTCWQAGKSERISRYRTGRKAEPGGLSLLVQRQVEAQVSGVIFTRNPISGDKVEMPVEAAPGLAGELLSGKVSPWRGTLTRAGHFSFQGKEQMPDPLDQVPWDDLAQVCLQVEKILGAEQDIEWVYGSIGDESKIWVVQSRPVTGASRIPQQVWTRANVAEVLPDPVTPLTWSVFRHTLLGPNEPSEAVRLVEGRVYLRLDDMLASFTYLPAVTPQIMTQVLGVSFPSQFTPSSPVRSPIIILAQMAFWLDAAGIFQRIDWLVKRLPELPRGEVARLPDLLNWTARCFSLHIKTTAYTISAYAVLHRLLSSWLTPERAGAILPRLLHGQAGLQTADQGRQLWQIAQSIRKQPRLAALIASRRSWPAIQGEARQLAGGAAFLEQFKAFLDVNGSRAAGEFELASPRWREAPETVLGILASYLSAPEPGTEGELLEQQRKRAAAELRASLSAWQWQLISRVLNAYQRYTTQRENLKYRLMQGYERLRQAFLAQGRGLKQRGDLADIEDVFFLELEELLSSEKDRDQLPSLEVIASRRSEHAQWFSSKPPLIWLERGNLSTSADASAEDGMVLFGIGSSPGVVTGSARVLNGIHESAGLMPGEILVTPHTDPGWTPLFLTCSAVVTEVGGFLSHGATVAREYGVPCVVNVQDATNCIHTGDQLQVDGSTGRVVILGRNFA